MAQEDLAYREMLGHRSFGAALTSTMQHAFDQALSDHPGADQRVLARTILLAGLHGERDVNNLVQLGLLALFDEPAAEA